MLYGDGIHSDTQGIQAMLDAGTPLVELPQPQACYLIDAPLLLHPRQELRLPRYAVIRLAAGSNCHMVENLAGEDITLTGGIWDYNNLEQAPNPNFDLNPEGEEECGCLAEVGEHHRRYDGVALYLDKVDHLVIRDLTLKDPTSYACTIDRASHFTVENIRFDFNLGNPRPVNMDGIHVCGNCHFGLIRNLHGACYDDTVALNADEGSGGPITFVTVRGIYARDSHSAVRLLSVKYPVEHIHIADIYGTFYQYCVGLTKYYEGETTGWFDAITLDNIHASKAERYAYLHVSEEYALHGYVYPFLYIEGKTRVKSMTVRDLYRREEHVAAPTLFVGENAVVYNLRLENIRDENTLAQSYPFLDKRGTIRSMESSNVQEIGKR